MIAGLTDWQVLELYLRPAAERAEEFERSHTAGGNHRPARAADSKPDYEPGTPEHRRQIVGAMVGTMGMKREAAEAMYEKQLDQWRAEQRKG